MSPHSVHDITSSHERSCRGNRIERPSQSGVSLSLCTSTSSRNRESMGSCMFNLCCLWLVREHLSSAQISVGVQTFADSIAQPGCRACQRLSPVLDYLEAEWENEEPDESKRWFKLAKVDCAANPRLKSVRFVQTPFLDQAFDEYNSSGLRP